MTSEEFGRIKYGDYIELKVAAASEIMHFGKIIHVNDPELIYLTKSIVWVQLHPLKDFRTKISWDYDYSKNYVKRLIDSPSERKMIKLLYD